MKKRHTMIWALAVILQIGVAGGFLDMNEAQAGIEEVTTLGGGCFWCLDAVYREMDGVRFVETGYAGGHDPDPTYQEVCTGTTGHAEVVQITFDPRKVSFEQLLAVFFTVHDPTTLNRQGADVGTQYRSVVFAHSKEQEASARKVIAELEKEKVFRNPVVTEVTRLKEFHRAEDYHQDYFRRNPGQGYCQAVIRPKLTKFRHKFDDLRK